jgi:hypothetical protein
MEIDGNAIRQMPTKIVRAALLTPAGTIECSPKTPTEDDFITNL